MSNYNSTVACSDGWTLVSDPAGSIEGGGFFQNIGPYGVWLQAHSSNSTAPADTAGGKFLRPGMALSFEAFGDVFPGRSADTNIWARCEMACQVSADHA